MDPTPALRALADAYSQALVHALGRELVSVVLYGSVARGEARPGSDVDLLVILESAPHLAERRRLLRPADQAVADQRSELAAAGLRAHVAPLVRTRAEAAHTRPLYLDLTEDAVLLFDREGFFAGVLERLRARMRALGSRRLATRGGDRYWVLKPDWKPGEVIEL